MIPEQAKSEIIRKRAMGQTWTSLVQWMKETFEIDIHRTTLQRWYDKEVYTEKDNFDVLEDSHRLERDKKVEALKADAKFWKRLYEKSIPVLFLYFGL